MSVIHGTAILILPIILHITLFVGIMMLAGCDEAGRLISPLRSDNAEPATEEADPRFAEPSETQLNRLHHNGTRMRDVLMWYGGCLGYIGTVSEDPDVDYGLLPQVVVEGEECVENHLLYPELFGDEWFDNGEPKIDANEFEGWLYPPDLDTVPIFMKVCDYDSYNRDFIGFSWFYIGPRPLRCE